MSNLVFLFSKGARFFEMFFQYGTHTHSFVDPGFFYIYVIRPSNPVGYSVRRWNLRRVYATYHDVLLLIRSCLAGLLCRH